MASVPGVHVIPNNTFRFEAGIEVTGFLNEAGGANAGDVVVSTDGIDWAIAGAAETGYTGVIMENPVTGAAFVDNDAITVRIFGGVVVNSTAAVINEGASVATAAAGTVVAQPIALIGDVDETFGMAVTAVDASGGKLFVLMRGA